MSEQTPSSRLNRPTTPDACPCGQETAEAVDARMREAGFIQLPSGGYVKDCPENRELFFSNQ